MVLLLITGNTIHCTVLNFTFYTTACQHVLLAPRNISLQMRLLGIFFSVCASSVCFKNLGRGVFGQIMLCQNWQNCYLDSWKSAR